MYTLLNGIEQQLEGHHDTIYCTKSQESALKSEVGTPSLMSESVDNLRVMGLDVQTLPRIERPIVCQKGEVFPLAKDYKNDEL